MSVQKLNELLQPLVEELGYEFVGLEYNSNPKHAVLRIYIDHENGVGIEDCEVVSRETAALLDVKDPIRSHYNLEVSSPGLDRPLFTAEHFTQFIGHEVKLRLHSPMEGQRRFKALIKGVEGDVIHLTSSETDEDWQISLDNIEKANLLPKL